MRDFSRAFGDHRWKLIVGVTSAQSGKTETVLDIIGERLDNRPAPILYVGPSKEFLTDQFEPRLNDLFRQSKNLLAKMAGGIDGKRQKKTLKRIAGVRLRLAHAGSSTALKSDPAALALVDEYDEMMRNVGGQGDPLGLIEARGDTYAEFQTGVISTPSVGFVDVQRDEASGLEFWASAPEDDIQSPIWRLWQSGTRHHFCWPCPHCDEYFVPRHRLLRYPDGATPAMALRDAWLECPHCGMQIREEHKAICNARGELVAPGQIIDSSGNVSGEPTDTRTFSFWASGLCSPFKTFGERAERFLRALATGDPDKIQTAVNAGFGELYLAGGGDLPEWKDIVGRKECYPTPVPDKVVYLVAGVDVQGNRLVYVIRGFGAYGTSWLIEHGVLWGKTKDPEVWDQLSAKLTAPIDGRTLKIAFIDSGFRPGKREGIPVNRVYDFCRRHKRFAFATKGSSHAMTRPLISSVIEVKADDARVKPFGLELVRLDPDHWKAVVHERLSFDREAPGAFHLNEQIDDDYCQQLVAEARVKGPSGRYVWVARSRENHFLDCEAMCAAAAWRLGVEAMKAGKADAKAKAAHAASRAVVGQGGAIHQPEQVAGSARSRFARFAGRFNR